MEPVTAAPVILITKISNRYVNQRDYARPRPEAAARAQPLHPSNRAKLKICVTV